mmetsp:Transcript_144446/g.462884  ORF Transcript_144446/g.462884 Transcript_144446/m.462884 type:complete len:223 (-) Transcript_144446:198-866(-)
MIGEPKQPQSPWEGRPKNARSAAGSASAPAPAQAPRPQQQQHQRRSQSAQPDRAPPCGNGSGCRRRFTGLSAASAAAWGCILRTVGVTSLEGSSAKEPLFREACADNASTTTWSMNQSCACSIPCVCTAGQAPNAPAVAGVYPANIAPVPALLGVMKPAPVPTSKSRKPPELPAAGVGLGAAITSSVSAWRTHPKVSSASASLERQARRRSPRCSLPEPKPS